MAKTRTEILRFAIVGTANFLIIMAVAWMLNDVANLNYLVSNVIAYIVAFINNFYWNRRWVFCSQEGNAAKQFLLFGAAYGIAYLMQLATVWALVTVASLDYNLANFIGMFPFGASNFMLNKFFTFKK